MGYKNTYVTNTISSLNTKVKAINKQVAAQKKEDTHMEYVSGRYATQNDRAKILQDMQRYGYQPKYSTDDNKKHRKAYTETASQASSSAAEETVSDDTQNYVNSISKSNKMANNSAADVQKALEAWSASNNKSSKASSSGSKQKSQGSTQSKKYDVSKTYADGTPVRYSKSGMRLPEASSTNSVIDDKRRLAAEYQKKHGKTQEQDLKESQSSHKKITTLQNHTEGTVKPNSTNGKSIAKLPEKANYIPSLSQNTNPLQTKIPNGLTPLDNIEKLKAQQQSVKNKYSGQSIAPLTGNLDYAKGKIEQWTNPNYKMSKSDKSDAEKMVKSYFKGKSGRDIINDPDTTNRDNMIKLALKSSKYASYVTGVLGAVTKLPLQLNSALMNAAGNDKVKQANKQVNNSIAKLQGNAQKQNPLSYGTGNFAGNAAMYSAANTIGDAAGLNGAVSGGLAKLMPQKVAQIGSNIITGQLADTALDTIPTEIQNYNNGMTVPQLAKDTAKNQGVNLLYNIGGEVLGAAGNAIGNKLGNSVKVPQPLKNIDETAKDVQQPLNNPEDVAKKVQQMQDETNAALKSEAQAQVVTQTAPSNIVPVDNTLLNARNAQIKQAKQSFEDSIGKFENVANDSVKADIENVRSQYDNLANAATKEDYASGINNISDSMKKLNADVSASGGMNIKNTVTEPDTYSAELHNKIKESTAGSTYRISPEVQQELKARGYSITQLNNMANMGQMQKNVKFRGNSGYPLNDSFEELDNALSGELSGYMRQVGLNPANDGDQVEGLAKFIQEHKPEKGTQGTFSPVTKTYDQSYSEDMMTDPISNLFGGDVQKWQDSLPTTNKVMAEDTGIGGKGIYNANAAEKGMQFPDSDNLTMNKKVSQFRTNTMENEGSQDARELYTHSRPKNYEYWTKPEQETLQAAQSRVNNDYDNAINQYSRDFTKSKVDKETLHNYSSTDIDTMMLLYQDLSAKGRQALADGDRAASNAYYAQARKITMNMQKVITNNAQSIQALAKWTRSSDGAITVAEGIAAKRAEDALTPKMAQGAKSVADQITEELNSNDLWNQLENAATPEAKSEIQSQVEDIVNKAVKANHIINSKVDADGIKKITDDVMNSRQGKDLEDTIDMVSTGFADIPAEDISKVQDIFDKAQEFGYNSKDRVDLENQAYSILANDLNVGRSFGDKINTWRYLSMLGNPRTHLKNMLGNTVFKGVNDISDTVSAVTESVLSKLPGGENMQRTKALMGFSQSDKDLINGSKDDLMQNAYRYLTGQKYFNVGNEIMNSGKAFSSKNKTLNRLMSPLQKAADINNNLLEKEDFIAMRGTFSRAEAGYLKANGADASIFKSTDPTDIELLQAARDYAVKKAQYAAFHEDNAVASALSQFSRNLGESDNLAAKGLHVGIEATIPFKKTPANIVKSGVDFSPIGAVKGLVESGSALKTGKVTASQAIDDMSKGLTGTGLFILGGWLASKGIVTASESGDDRKKYYDQMTGKQEYSLNIPINGKDYSFTISDLAPSAIPLLSGAQFEQMKEGESTDWGVTDLVDIAMQVGNPVMDTTMLQGLSQNLDAISNANTDSNSLVTAAQEAAINYAGQMIPTLSGQIARTLDPLRRSTYTGATGTEKMYKKFGLQTQNKIPVLSKNSEPYIDQWGRTVNNTGGSNIFVRAAQNFALIGYLQQKNVTPVDNQIKSLYDATKDANVLPQSSAGTISVGGASYRMTPKELTAYNIAAGQTKYDLVDKLTNSDFYKNMSNDDKKEAVETMYNVANAAAGEKTIKGYTNDSSAYKAYKEGGADGLLKYIDEKTALASEGLTMGNDKAVEAYESKGSEGLKEYSETKKALNDAGLSYTDKNVELYNQQGASGLKDKAQMQQDFDSANVDTSNKKAVAAYEKGGTKALKEYSTYSHLLKNNGVSDTEKTEKIYADKGSEGIQTYAEIKRKADSDGNGSLKKSELKSYLDSTGMSRAQKKYWFGYLSRAKNPY